MSPGSFKTEPIFASRQAMVRADVLARSRLIQSPHFLRSAEGDLRLLFENYDRHFFGNTLSAALRAQSPVPLALDWSGRLRSSGGVTTRLRNRRGVLSFRITVSQPLLFDNFRNGESAVVVGLPCADRLDGLMRIFEHELLHLHEFLAFGRSNCARPRFQKLAATHFGHAEHRHRLITPRQRMLAQTTLRPGSLVRFVRDGQELRGRINRIHTRATVLVASSKGQRYTDGGRYEKFYVPLALLKEI
ncbi:MAG: hypothetical protein JWM57_2132 [Phycisphaerales bacterium]|nr:hypothetical protein [Phycisphaerales bacterium]